MKLYKSLLIGTLLAGGFSHQAMAQQMPLDWANSMPGAGGDSGKDIVTDANGDVILLSDIAGTVDFEPGVGTTNLTTAGSTDAAIAKYDSDGNLIWAVKVGGAGAEQGTSVDVDNAGNIYVAGVFQSIVDFDPGVGTANLTSNGGYDNYILKLDVNGNFIWAKQIGSVGDDGTTSISIDPTGNVLISGYFRNTIDFDPNAGVVNATSLGGAEAFVLKLNSAGDFVWRYVVGSTTDDDARALTTDASGNVYVTGYFSGTVDFDFSGATQNLTGTGVTAEIFVLKISSSGNYMGAVGAGSTGTDSGRAITVDSNDDVLVTGLFAGTVDFDPGIGTNSKTSGGGFDIFVLKLNNTLGHVWAGHASGPSDDEGWSIETDNEDNVFIAGFFRNTVDFDPNAGTQNVTVSCACSFADQFYWKLDSDGNYVSANKAGETNNDHSYAFYPSGNDVYITGYLQGTSDYDFDAGVTNLISAGSGDIYLAKYYNCNPIHVNDVIVSCGPITWIDGNTYSADNNTATQFYTSVNGCDSTVHLNLMIKAIDDQTVTTSISTICDDDNVTVDLGSSQAGVFYSLVDQSTMTVFDGPLEGNGATLTLDAGNVTTTTTYEVQAERNKFNTLTFTGNSLTPTHVVLGSEINKEFAGATTLTVESWINSDNNNNLQTAVSNYTSLGNTMQYLLRLDHVSGQNKATFSIGTGTVPGSYIQVVGTTTILPDTWYHIAGSYDGTNISIYVNGVLENQVAVTTPLPNLTNEVRIGGGLDNNTEYFYGDITGVRIWNVARTQTEINDNMDVCIDGNESGLIAMYNMVDGTGSSTLTDESVNGFNGTLTNMDANTSWNYTNMPSMTCSICTLTMTETPTVTVNYSNTGTDVQATCDVYTWIDGNTYTTSNSSATHLLTNMDGCDSLVTLNLTITTTPVAGATNNGDGTLSATGTGSYQWINCGTNTPISGATSASFTPSSNGDYSVVVTNGSCDDTSTCVNYNSVGINENGAASISLYPNPTNGMFVIAFGELNTNVNVVITNALGQIVYNESFISTQKTEINLDQPTGVYFVNVYSEDQLISTLKLIRQ